ncbi:MAG: putative nucleic-acid-binding protein, contains PIN domain [Phormidium sp. OSCR]|nr:MAG: putative nucleic-acid-binding protein, contains PIN domain [Phormidium sp. OSCR]
MSNRIFIDTNIWVYLYARNAPVKSGRAKEIVSQNFESIIISSQVLGELYNVLTRKNIKPKPEARQIVLTILSNFHVTEIDTAKVIMALDISERYGYSYWDSLLIGTALHENCEILYSEDMQNLQIIESKTRIINPLY